MRTTENGIQQVIRTTTLVKDIHQDIDEEEGEKKLPDRKPGLGSTATLSNISHDKSHGAFSACLGACACPLGVYHAGLLAAERVRVVFPFIMSLIEHWSVVPTLFPSFLPYPLSCPTIQARCHHYHSRNVIEWLDRRR